MLSWHERVFGLCHEAPGPPASGDPRTGTRPPIIINAVLNELSYKTLHFKIICPTQACTIPAVGARRAYIYHIIFIFQYNNPHPCDIHHATIPRGTITNLRTTYAIHHSSVRTTTRTNKSSYHPQNPNHLKMVTCTPGCRLRMAAHVPHGLGISTVTTQIGVAVRGAR